MIPHIIWATLHGFLGVEVGVQVPCEVHWRGSRVTIKPPCNNDLGDFWGKIDGDARVSKSTRLHIERAYGFHIK